MALTVGVKLLEGLFAAGIIGSALVILLAGIEDIRTTLSGSDEG